MHWLLDFRSVILLISSKKNCSHVSNDSNWFSGLCRFSAIFGGDGQSALSRYITVYNLSTSEQPNKNASYCWRNQIVHEIVTSKIGIKNFGAFFYSVGWAKLLQLQLNTVHKLPASNTTCQKHLWVWRNGKFCIVGLVMPLNLFRTLRVPIR